MIQPTPLSLSTSPSTQNGEAPGALSQNGSKAGEISGFMQILGENGIPAGATPTAAKSAAAAQDTAADAVTQPDLTSGKSGKATGNMLPLAAQMLPIGLHNGLTASSTDAPSGESDTSEGLSTPDTLSEAQPDETDLAAMVLPEVTIPAFLAQDPVLAANIRQPAQTPRNPSPWDALLGVSPGTSAKSDTSLAALNGTATPAATAQERAMSALPSDLRLAPITMEAAARPTVPAAPSTQSALQALGTSAALSSAQTPPTLEGQLSASIADQVAQGASTAASAQAPSELLTKASTQATLDATTKRTLESAELDNADPDSADPDSAEARLPVDRLRPRADTENLRTRSDRTQDTGSALAPASLAASSTTTLAAPLVQEASGASSASVTSGNTLSVSASAGSATTASEGPQDFTTLVSRLHEAREASGTQVVRTALVHSQFGHVALQFRPDDAGMSVAMSSADPDFAASVQTAAASILAAASAQGSDASRDGTSGQQQQSNQPQNQSASSSNPDQKNAQGFAQSLAQDRSARDGTSGEGGGNSRPASALEDADTGNANTQQASAAGASSAASGTIYA